MIRWLGYACLAIICGAILTAAGVLAWFIADRSPPVRILSREVLTPSVKPGGKLVIRTTVDYVRNCKGHVDRILFDSQPLPPVTSKSTSNSRRSHRPVDEA